MDQSYENLKQLMEIINSGEVMSRTVFHDHVINILGKENYIRLIMECL